MVKEKNFCKITPKHIIKVIVVIAVRLAIKIHFQSPNHKHT